MCKEYGQFFWSKMPVLSAREQGGRGAGRKISLAPLLFLLRFLCLLMFLKMMLH
jgi:hypothetical protein